MNDYVIYFHENKQDHKVVWSGWNPADALATFWASFDKIDAKGVSDVKIFALVEIVA